METIGRYRVLGEAGRGGMAVVYEAEDAQMARRVAVKAVMLPAHLSAAQRDSLVTRLRREARAVARLSHPNIVTVYDVGEENGTHYLVMEFLDGQTLRERLDTSPLSPAEASRVLDQVAAAVDAVHAQGVVHRDIKPSNVMLLADGRIKLMDFGVARQNDDTLVTQTGMMVGSPAYMAPEILSGEDATPASDVWSLGVLLYQMLAGRPPFDSPNLPTVLYQVAHSAPAPLPHVTGAMGRILARALEKDPRKRFPSAQALAEAFRAALPAPAPLDKADKPIAPITKPPLPPVTLRDTPPIAPRRRALLPFGALLLALGGALYAGHRLASPRPAPRVLASAPATMPAQAPVKPAQRTAQHQAVVRRPAVVRVAATPIEARRTAERRARPVPPVRLRPARPPAAVAAAPRTDTRQRRALSSTAPKREARVRLRSLPLSAAAARRTAAPKPAPKRRVRLASLPPVPLAPAPRLAPPAPRTAGAAPPAGTNLVGTWHGWQGIHGHSPVVLTITRHQGASFDGVMTVRTPEHATVRVALVGRVSPGGQVTMHETRILSSTKPRAWDLGDKSGHLGAAGQMSGVDHDTRGRTATWSFSR